jgi:hypothetical protein
MLVRCMSACVITNTSPVENARSLRSSEKQCLRRDTIVEKDINNTQHNDGAQTRTHSLPLLMNLSKSIPMSARTKRHI